MKTFTKHILLLALMLFGVAGAAWALPRAPQKFTSAVNLSVLQEGDTLAEGASITFDIGSSGWSRTMGVVPNRAKKNGGPIPGAYAVEINLGSTIGAGGVIINDNGSFTPVTQSGDDGDAWVVTYLEVDGENENIDIEISGVLLLVPAPDPTVPALDELTGNWNFLMPGANKVVKVTYKAEPALAWTFGDRAIPNDTTITAYRGFELPVIGNIGAIMNHDFYTALLGGTVSLRYGSTNPAVISFTDPNDMWSVSVNGAGECNVYMVFDGNDDYQYDSVAFHAVIANPATLTLSPSAGGTLELAGMGVDTVYNITLEQSGISGDNRSFTIPASRFPYDTTFSYNANVSFAYAYDQMGGSVDIFAQGDNWITVRISGPFKYGGYYSCELEGGASDDWTIYCTATGTQPKMPYGISKTGDNTYSVMEGLTVNVTATPDSAHYLSRIDDHDTMSNHACGYSFVMPSSDKALAATFTTKPTLTLTQTDGGTLEAIVPSGNAVWGDGTDNIVLAHNYTADGITFTTTDGTGIFSSGQWFAYPDNHFHFTSESGNFSRIEMTLTGNMYYTDWNDAEGWTVDATSAVWEGDANEVVIENCTTYVKQITFVRGGTANVTPSTEPNTYYIDYGTPVTVVATPDAQHYLVSFSDDAPATELNSNLAVEKTYDSVIADIPDLTANFQAKPTLTLAANDGGTLTLDGVTPGETTYNITIEGGNTYTNVSFPFQTTVFLHEDLDEVYDDNLYPLSVERDGNNAVINISEPYGGSKTIMYGYGDGEGGHKFITCDAIEGLPIMPEGVTYAGYDTYMVDYNTDVTVVATPDSIHYLATLGEELVNSNDSIHRTFTMTAPVNLPADFRAKPTLTLAHNDGGEMEIVPAGGVTAMHLTTDQIPTWSGVAEPAMEADLQPFGFVAVDSAAAAAWTGAPASGEIHLLYAPAGDKFKAHVFRDGQWSEASTADYLKGNIYLFSDILYFTTGASSNVTATAEPNTYYIDYGTDVTVKAMPAKHYHLQGWSCTPGTIVDNLDSTATLTMTQNETVSATFAQNAPELAWMYDQEAMPAEGVSAYDGFMVDTIMKISMSCSDEFIAAVQQDNATVHYGSVNGVVTFANPLRLMSVQINGIGPDTIYAVHDGSVMAYDSVWFPVNIMAPDTLTLVHNDGGEMTVETLTDSIRAIVADTTYAVVPGANVTVVAMPDSAHYLVNFVGGADTNSNVAVNTTFVVTADTTLTATFTAKPVLTLAANDTTWGSVTIPIGLVATDPTPAPTPTAVANPVITGVLMPDGSMQVTMSCTTQDADIYYTTDNVTSPTCDCPAAPEYTQPITFTEPVTIKAAAYTGNDWSAVVTKTITLGLPAGVAQLTDSTYMIDYGTEVTVNAEATTLHHIAGWISEDSVAYPADSITYGNYFITEPDSLFPALSMLTFTVTADTTAEALFGLNSYDVFATAQLDDRDEIGSGLAMGRIAVIYTNVEGSVQGAGPADTLTYTAQGGSNSMLVVNSNYGYDFSGWYDVAADTLLSDAAMLSLTAAATVEARFVPDTFEVSAVVAVPGDTLATAGTVTGAARYAYREMVTLEETPATGYHFVNWTAADSSVLGTDDSLTLQLVKDTVLTANFDTNVYNVVADVNIEGLGTVTGAGEVKHFLSTTLVATANLKYHFVMWVNAAGDSVSAADTLEVFPVGDTALTAVFDTNIYATVWSGETDTTYTSLPYEGLTATYTDFWGNEHTPVLTFVCGDQTVVTPNYPVTAGTWTVTATGAEGDSLTAPETTLTIKRAIVNVTGAVVETAKFADGTTTAVVTNAGTLNNVQGSDRVQHTTTAAYNTATVGDNKTITVTYALNGAAALLANYTLTPTTEVYTTEGYIIEPMVPNTDRPEDDTTVVEQGFDVYAYGYCTGSGYSIRYHLNTGAPDQYKLDFADSRFTDVDWTNLATPGADGTIDIVVPVDMPMGDYSVTVTFRDSRFTWLESAPMTMNFHINLPETFTMPLFNNVIALVDTCQCFSDIQWYHRANSSEEWKAIPGANGYYYHATDAELEGEFFVKAKYNGVETFTCPQTDMETLYTDDEQTVSVTAYPNPTTDGVTITVDGGTEWVHTLRVLSTVGVEKESRTFEGFTTTVDMRGYAKGAYMVIVDGVVVRVVRN